VAAGLLTSAESGPRREAVELAEGYVRSPGNVGLVVGLLVRDECLCLGCGKVAEDFARPPDAGTVFEIGSSSTAIRFCSSPSATAAPV